jgi:hypothetical protein
MASPYKGNAYRKGGTFAYSALHADIPLMLINDVLDNCKSDTATMSRITITIQLSKSLKYAWNVPCRNSRPAIMDRE